MGVIYNIHSVNDPKILISFLSFLKSRYKMLSVEELEFAVSDNRSLQDFCHITIDDGDRSAYKIIYPILKQLSIPASLFVSPEACVERKNLWFQEIEGYDLEEIRQIILNRFRINDKRLKGVPVFYILKCMPIHEIWNIIKTYQQDNNIKEEKCKNLTIEELREIDRQGLVKIGAHSCTHPILANENDDICEREIAGSIKGLELILGHKIEYFAYPNGKPGLDFGDREINILRNKDIKFAFSCAERDITVDYNCLSIPRYSYIVIKSKFSSVRYMYIMLRHYGRKYLETFHTSLISNERNAREEIKILVQKYYQLGS